MKLHNPNDIAMFYQYRNKCRNSYHDICYIVCKETGRLCDEDVCPIIKNNNDIDDFIDCMKRMEKYENP